MIPRAKEVNIEEDPPSSRTPVSERPNSFSELERHSSAESARRPAFLPVEVRGDGNGSTRKSFVGFKESDTELQRRKSGVGAKAPVGLRDRLTSAANDARAVQHRASVLVAPNRASVFGGSARGSLFGMLGMSLPQGLGGETPRLPSFRRTSQNSLVPLLESRRRSEDSEYSDEDGGAMRRASLKRSSASRVQVGDEPAMVATRSLLPAMVSATPELSPQIERRKIMERTGMVVDSPRTQKDLSMMRALRRVKVLAACSDRFLLALGNGSERMTLQPREARDIREHNHSAAVIVQSGSCRVEIGRMLVDECISGSAFGLGGVLAGITRAKASTSITTGNAFPEMAIRASGAEGCRLLILRTAAVKHALAACPDDQPYVRDLVRMLTLQGVDVVRQLLGSLQCCETAKGAVLGSSTRHLYMPGEIVFHEGKKTPMGLILIRSGTVALQIGGVEVRRVSEGQVLGEEMLLGVSSQWSTTARCTTTCDMQIMHRRVFLSLIKDMQAGAEEQRESQRLLTLLTGRWREERVILSWPLFRGYDPEFLGSLAKLVETRVAFPGGKVCEAGLAGVQKCQEVALYFLVHGTCEVSMASDRGRPKAEAQGSGPGGEGQGRQGQGRRALAAGAIVGAREFLGLRETYLTVVTARTLSLISVLHRGVFLDLVDRCHRELQSNEVSGEVMRLLREDLDRQEPLPVEERADPRRPELNERRTDGVIRRLPFLRGCDSRLVDTLCQSAHHRFCLSGQRLCFGGQVGHSMFVLVRGSVAATIDGVYIRTYVRGQAFNTLALSSDVFKPSYTATCERTCELWALRRTEFTQALRSFTVEKRHFVTLLSDPLQSLSIASRKGAEHVHEGGDSLASSRKSSSVHKQHGHDESGPELCAMEVFRECSLKFIVWIQENLETTMWFPDDVIVQEGDDDSCLYIVCQGTVILEGAVTQHAQVSLGPGASFGEQRFLDVADSASATATAIEVCVLQVMHPQVLQRGLELFPAEAVTLDSIGARWTGTSVSTASTTASLLHQVRPFTACSMDFCHALASSVRSRLVRRGDLAVQAGATDNLVILKSGNAVIEGGIGEDGGKRVPELTAMNAAAVLGIAKTPAVAVRAERACVVFQLQASVLLGALRKHPAEVSRLCQCCLGVQKLWPVDPEVVPLFRGTGQAFFDRLVNTSEWQLVLPGCLVVHQGMKSSLMFLLCYGTAQTQRDGIPVGGQLGPGDCVGRENFFKLTDKYKTSVRAVTLCHARGMSAQDLDDALAANPAEVERFQQLKQQVAREMEEQDGVQAKQVSREKLRRRVSGAFRRYVANVRSLRHVADEGRGLGACLKSDDEIIKIAMRRRKLLRAQVQSQVVSQMSEDPPAPGINETSAESRMRGSDTSVSESTEDEINSPRSTKPGIVGDPEATNLVVKTTSETEYTLPAPGASSADSHASLASLWSAAWRSRKRRVRGHWVIKTAPVHDSSGSRRGSRRRSSSAGSSLVDSDSDSDCNSSSDEDSESFSSEQEPQTERVIQKAITDYAAARKEEILRGKVLRALKSDLRPNVGRGVRGVQLSEAELRELDVLLPPLPGASGAEGGNEAAPAPRARGRRGTPKGWLRKRGTGIEARDMAAVAKADVRALELPPETERALNRRLIALVGRPLRVVRPARRGMWHPSRSQYTQPRRPEASALP